MSTLGGAVCVREATSLDYPWVQAVQSLLPVCDEVVICVGSGGKDNTEWEAREMVAAEPKLKLCIYDWPDPKGDPDFWVTWLNVAREHLSSDFHFQLDADEILHENSYSSVRAFISQGGDRSAIVTRWNFWRDHRHTIPDGHCLGKRVIRIAPAKLWMASDGAHHMGGDVVRMRRETDIEIFHYGFIRKRQAFFEKAKALQKYFFDSYDPRLTSVEERMKVLDAENKPGNWMAEISGIPWVNSLDEFTGSHPKCIQSWLAERGYAV